MALRLLYLRRSRCAARVGSGSDQLAERVMILGDWAAAS